MTNRIIVGVDSSAVARPALDVAAWLGGLLGAEVDAVHVPEDGAHTVEAEASAAGVPLRQVVGDAGRVLADELSASDVILGVVGSRGRAGGPRPAGHVAAELLQHTTKPVVVVPPDCRDPFRHRDGGVLLVALDGGAATARALEQPIELFAEAGLEVVVLHVFEPAGVPRFWDQPQHATASWAEEFQRRFCHRTDVKVHLRAGAPADRVLEVAKDEAASLIALAWTQDLSVGRSEVVRQALGWSSVPVLLVPVPAVIELDDSTPDRVPVEG